LNKIIWFDLTLPTHKKVVFFFILLISLSFKGLNAQTNPSDTLKKVSADTLNSDSGADALEETIDYAAEDSIVGLPGDGNVLLYGKAVVNYGSMKMESEFMEIDYTKNTISAYGKKDSLGNSVGTPIFRDGGETPIEAEKIMYNLKTRKGKIFNALTKQGELLVIGDEIKKDSTDVIYFKDMRCIPCQEEDAKSARTVFRATKAKVIPNDKIVTGPMYLEVGGVPTPLGLPFGYFPSTKKQHNGVLLPTFGNSPSFGYNLKQGGFYWGINDQTDMIIRTDLYANGSYMVGLNNNYNILYKSNGSTSISYSEFNLGDKDIPALFSKQKGYEVRWQHFQDNKNNPRVRFSANVNYVNNQNFNRLNAVNTGQYLQNNFQSNVNFTRSFKLSNISVNALHNQNSITKQVNITLPALTFNVNRFFPFRRENALKPNVFDKIGINYLFEARNTLSGYDSTIFKGSLLDSAKYGFRHSLPISTNFTVLKYITVSPGINLSSVMYMKSIHKEYFHELRGDSQIVEGVKTVEDKGFVAGYDANFSTNINTQVYFDYMFRKGRVKQIRHLMIPTLNYTYRPDFGQSQYGFWKNVQRDSLGRIQTYSIFERGLFGGPSVGKQNSVGVNLSNNIETKLKQNTDTGVTYRKVVAIQNLGLNGSYNFAADSMNMSPITITARTVLFKYIDITANSLFDPYVYNKTTNSVINKYVFDADKRLARLTNAGFTAGFNIGSDNVDALKKARTPNATNGAERGAEIETVPRDKLPWRLGITYALLLTNSDDRALQPSHTLQFTGNMMPTKYWKIGVSTNFDFTRQKFFYTSIDLYRDLKCWEARIQWIPFGPRRSYNFGINLKASMLRDFRIPRQRSWYDFR
jgi:hypothetical protein